MVFLPGQPNMGRAATSIYGRHKYKGAAGIMAYHFRERDYVLCGRLPDVRYAQIKLSLSCSAAKFAHRSIYATQSLSKHRPHAKTQGRWPHTTPDVTEFTRYGSLLHLTVDPFLKSYRPSHPFSPCFLLVRLHLCDCRHYIVISLKPADSSG